MKDTKGSPIVTQTGQETKDAAIPQQESGRKQCDEGCQPLLVFSSSQRTGENAGHQGRFSSVRSRPEDERCLNTATTSLVVKREAMRDKPPRENEETNASKNVRPPGVAKLTGPPIWYRSQLSYSEKPEINP
jgi:hypothetical protein